MPKPKYFSLPYQFVFFGILIFASNGSNIFSWFSIIDDHQLILLLDDGVLNIDRAWEYILSISDYAIGETGRFRPLFYPIVILELYLFGDNIWMYYFSRLLGFTCLSSVLYRFACIYLEKYISLLVPLLLISSPTYSDFLGRIIASESIAIWFVVSFVYSTNYFLRMLEKKIFVYNLTYYLHLASYFLSSILLVSIKENFSVIALVTLFLSIQFFRNQRATNASRLWMIFMLIQSIIVVGVLAIIGSYFITASESIKGYGIGLISIYEYVCMFLAYVLYIAVLPSIFALYLFFRKKVFFWK